MAPVAIVRICTRSRRLEHFRPRDSHGACARESRAWSEGVHRHRRLGALRLEERELCTHLGLEALSLSISVTLVPGRFRAIGVGDWRSHRRVLAIGMLDRDPAGWPRCAWHGVVHVGFHLERRRSASATMAPRPWRDLTRGERRTLRRPPPSFADGARNGERITGCQRAASR